MAKYCTCAGDFVNTLDIDELAKKLQTFKGIARYENKLLWFNFLMILFFNIRVLFRISLFMCLPRQSNYGTTVHSYIIW